MTTNRNMRLRKARLRRKARKNSRKKRRDAFHAGLNIVRLFWHAGFLT